MLVLMGDLDQDGLDRLQEVAGAVVLVPLENHGTQQVLEMVELELKYKDLLQQIILF